MLFASSLNTAVQPALNAVQAMVLSQPTSPMTRFNAWDLRLPLMPALIRTPMTAMQMKEYGWSVIWLAKLNGEQNLNIIVFVLNIDTVRYIYLSPQPFK